jgi:hypothetical protein
LYEFLSEGSKKDKGFVLVEAMAAEVMMMNE